MRVVPSKWCGSSCVETTLVAGESLVFFCRRAMGMEWCFMVVSIGVGTREMGFVGQIEGFDGEVVVWLEVVGGWSGRG